MLRRRDNRLLFLLVRYGQSPEVADAIFIGIVSSGVAVAFGEDDLSSVAIQNCPDAQVSVGVILNVGTSTVERVHDVPPTGQGRPQDVEYGVVGVVARGGQLLVYLGQFGATEEDEAWFAARL